MPTDEEYLKQLEKENELLRRKIEMNPTLREILGKYFCLSKEVNKVGEESYGLTLTPMKIQKKDYEYLESVGIPLEESYVEDAFTNSFIFFGNDKDVKQILDEYYKNIKVPKDYFEELNKPCPYKSLADANDKAKEAVKASLDSSEEIP